MLRLWLICGLIVFSLLCAHADALDNNLPRTMAKLRAGQPVTVVGFGDSITTFYGNRDFTGFHPVFPESFYYGVVAQFLRMQFPNAPMRVINAGVGGNTAVDGLKRLDKDVLASNPDLVFVMFGANDSGAFPLDAYEENMREIIRRLRADGPRDIVLVASSPSPCGPPALVATNRVIMRLGKELGLPTYDGFLGISPLTAACDDNGFPVHSLQDLFTFYGGIYPPQDPIHPNVQGHFQLGRYLYRALSGRPFPTSPLTSQLQRVFLADGTASYRLRVENTTGQPVAGDVQVLLPAGVDVAGVERKTLQLPNGVEAVICPLPAQHLVLPAHGVSEITWTSPALQRVPSPDRWTYFDPQRITPVVRFSRENGPCFVDYVGLEAPTGPAIRAIAFPTALDHSAVVALPSMPVKVSVTPSKEPLAVQVTWRGKRQLVPVSATGEATVALDVSGLSDTTLALATFGLLEQGKATGRVLDLRQQVVQIAPLLSVLPDHPSPWMTVNTDAQSTGLAAPNTPRNLSGRFNVARHGDALRMSWQISDDHLVAQRDGFHTDGVEIYLDRAGKTFQLGAFLPAGLVPGPARVAPGNGASAAEVAGVRAQWAPRAGGYTLTVDLPLALVNPAGQDILRFSAAINDIDTMNNPIQVRHQFQWMGNGPNYWKVNRYGALTSSATTAPSVVVNVFP
ncbi:MAG TPA: GDSL-type esterase/lipase family protein [Armatimonadota bacterium]|jgi:lysophospholipase L1-like esterase